MKTILYFLLTAALLLLGRDSVVAQDHTEHPAQGEHAFPAHLIGLDIGHAHLFEQDEEGNKGLLSLPSFGINYTLQINEHWGLGLHTDLIFEEYKILNEVQGQEHEEIERIYPIAPALLGIFKFNEHWSVLAGLGREFSKGENFWLNRAGVEYGVSLPAGWELFGTLQYDVKWDAYDNWVFALGLAKHL